tara:strand:- start:3037 stop:3378 length:342 start_codon:yes stop_codon:yes gene_type:complete
MRHQTVAEASHCYGSNFVYHNSRRIATEIAVHYGYATEGVHSSPLLVRVYNRTNNEMKTIPFTDVLALIPVRPAKLHSTRFGQVIVSDAVYISTNIYACITAVLVAIDTVKGT